MASGDQEKAHYGYDQPGESAPPYQPSPQPQGYAPQAQGYSPQAYAPSPQPITYQPSSHSTVVVNSGPPRPVAAPQNIRFWSTGLFGCFEDCDSLCYSFWCYPCFMCSLSERLGEHCCGPLCCGCAFNTVLRNKVRTMYGIQGTICDDICAVMCCEMCAMCQLKRELDAMDRAQNSQNAYGGGNVQITTTTTQHQPI